MSEHVPFETSSIRAGLRVLASLIWAMAAAAMAFVMAPSQAPWETLLAVVLAGVAAYLWSHCGGLWPPVADCPLLLWPLAAFLVWRLLVAAGEVVPELDATAVLATLPEGLAARIQILAGLFVAVAVCWLLSWLWQGLRAYFATVDLFELCFGGALAGMLPVLLYGVYRLSDGYWASVDVIFSIDSGLVSENMLPDPTYADLRHPLYSFLFWPLDVWLNDLASLTPEPAFAHHLLWGVLGAWMLVGVALLLYRLSGRRRHVAFLYMTTMPVGLFCFFVEKYQPAVFFLVLTVAALVRADARRASGWGLAATGCMSSSAPLLLAVLVTRSPRELAKRFGALLCSGLGLLAVSGRLHVLLHLADYWQDVHQFTEIALTVKERIVCYFNGVYACFFPLAHRLYEDRLYWRSVGQDLRLLGVVILAVALLGFILHHRERAYQLFFAWLVFQPLFTIVFAWSPLESPLFSLYFSWAIVPLFCAGLYGILSRFPRLFALMAGLLCGALLLLNGAQWLYILSLLVRLYPAA